MIGHSDRTRTAAVIGGGIGGLTAAISLRRAGLDVTVFERAATPPATGTGLGIWPSALTALDALGLGRRLRELGRPQPDGALHTPDGTTLGRLDTTAIARKHGDPVYLIARPTLLDLLGSALPDGVVHTGAVVEDVPSGYDVVVGADGVHSGTRTALFGEQYPARYTGSTAWRGTVPLDVPRGGETWGKGALFGFTPLAPGVTNWYASLVAPPGYVPDDDIDELLFHFGQWHDPIPRIIDAAREESILHHDLYHSTPLPTYVDGNVALIGDAAHAMAPNLGQGACQAMIDAEALGSALAGENDVATALRRYDERRRRPSQRMAARSAHMNRIAVARRGIGVRNGLIRTALRIGGPPA
ncbi:2-polyprenyl-6-methoxyphenol hydroxylase [Saccharomonospora sp. CUA-673]|uniref:FAD-dependent oxidoreductase n=1 Tax=Saccharomonospora sp. CUA-673 TaxID=1904969 RepID=UPI00095E9375|nr:FAD-dependent oxidoreductase [Saccharomonospora sp. CUA-673]OLT39976.1 2-polyprenyl-6-methoxyphenol hydroxylase [Saccharomonospora sp. CUA-673]